MGDSSVVCQGWLEWKKRAGVTLRYKNYWFVLRRTDATKKSGQLECYDNNLSISKKPNDITKLKSALAIGKRQAKEKAWAFEILFEGKKEQYAAHSSEDRDKWLSAFKKVNIAEVGDVGSQFDVVVIPTEASQKLEISLRRHDLVSQPLTMQITPTHLSLHKQNDHDSSIISWSLSHLGPVSHSTANKDQGERGTVTVKVNDTGSHSGQYQFSTQQYKEVTRAIHNKLQSLIVKSSILTVSSSAPLVHSRSSDDIPRESTRTGSLSPPPLLQQPSPTRKSPFHTQTLPVKFMSFDASSVSGIATLPRNHDRTRTRPSLHELQRFPRQESDGEEEPDYIPDGDINPRGSESDDEPSYIRKEELNPRIDELTGKAKILSFSASDEDEDVDPYLKLISEKADADPYLTLEDPDPYHKTESDPYLEIKGDAYADEPVSYVTIDDQEGDGQLYISVGKDDGKSPPSPVSSKRHHGKQSHTGAKLTRFATIETDKVSPLSKHNRNPLMRLRTECEPIPPPVPVREPPPLPRREDKPVSNSSGLPAPCHKTTPEGLPTQVRPPLPSRCNTMPTKEQLGASIPSSLIHGSSVPSRPPPLPHRQGSDTQPPPPPLPTRNTAGSPSLPNRMLSRGGSSSGEDAPSLPRRRESSGSVQEVFSSLPTRTEESSIKAIPPPLPARTGSGGTPPIGSPASRRPPLPIRRDNSDTPPYFTTPPLPHRSLSSPTNLPPPLPDRSIAQRALPVRPQSPNAQLPQRQEMFETGPDYLDIDSDREMNSYVEV